MEELRGRGFDPPSPYTDHGLDWIERRERRALRHGLVFMMLVSAAGTALLALMTGDVLFAAVAGALIALGYMAFHHRLTRAQRRNAATRRAAVRELVSRADELEPNDGETVLERTHAERRRAVLIVLAGGWICVPPTAALMTIGFHDVAGPVIGWGAFLVVLTWFARDALRDLSRGLERERANLTDLLAGR